jgi:DNA repair protein RecN (Recombination protein N)
LEQVRGRVRRLADLRRKYGDDESAILSFLERARHTMAALVGADGRRAALADEAEELGGEVAETAAELSRGRRTAAPRLAAAIDEELRALGMSDAAVRVALDPLSERGPLGDERVELRLRAGAQQPDLPLARTASGGELSRVMLACRSVLADLDDVPTLIFDEVDAGIGGRAGVAVGRRLARLASTRQVLVVTHLPQIASFADRHIRVEKERGVATASALDENERVDELSRMLSGLWASETAAVHAGELLSEASREKALAR